MSDIIPLARRLPLTLADIRDDDERVIICCLACGRRREMPAYLLRKMVGPISLGTINGRFGCRGKGGCGKAIGIVLPRLTPTPAAWASVYRPSAADHGVRHDAPPDHFAFHIEEWLEKPDSRTRTIAQVMGLDMAHAVFDLAALQMDRPGRLYLVIRHQGRVLRDSRRNFQLVTGGRDQGSA